MFLIFILTNLLFLCFFWKIDFIYWIYVILFVLSIVFVLSFFTNEWQKNWKQFIKEFFFKYLSYINLIVILLWLFFLFKYFFINNYWEHKIIDFRVTFGLIAVTSIIYFFWIIFTKEDFTKISLFGWIILWWYLWYLLPDWKIFNYFVAFILSINCVWFLIYYIKHYKISKLLLYIIFFSTLIWFFIIIHEKIFTNYITFALSIQFVIWIILLFMLQTDITYKKLLQIGNKIKQRQHEMNLFWYSDTKLTEYEEKFYSKHIKKQDSYKFFIDFFINSPKQVKIIFAITNTTPLIIASYYFFTNILYNRNITNEIYYWLWSIMFFVNFILFKKLSWFVVIQRFFSFFVINFITYFSIIDFFWKNYLYIAIWGIVWNLLSTILILIIWKKRNIFDAVDYLFWSIINFLWVFVNIYFLLKLDIMNYLKIWIILLYLWVYMFLYRMIFKKILE